jgi:hypothetical protein
MPILARAGAAAARGFGMLGKIAAAVDEYFKYVTLLLPGNGTNGAQNNTFLDSSTNNFTITRNGNTTQGTFSPYGNLWSNYFDGSGDWLSVPDNNALDLSGDFTIEFWLNVDSGNLDRSGVVGKRSQSSWNTDLDWVIRVETSAGKIGFGYDAAGNYYDMGSYVVGEWAYYAITRSGTSIRTFKNGVQIATATDSRTYTTTESLRIGINGPGLEYKGYISNLRIVKGTAVYTSAFTPSTTPLTAITNTSLLTCQSNRFVDNSTNNFTVSIGGGTPSVQRFSPFNPTAPYAAGTDGGSGYFDGSGDYIRVASNTDAALSLGTSDFTYEAWVYPTAFVSGSSVIGVQTQTNGTAGNGFALYLTNTGAPGVLAAASSGGYAVNFTGTAIPLNAWTHLAVTRSGNTFTLWRNGVSDGTATVSVTITQDSTSGYGGWNTGASPQTGQGHNGYIVDRLTKSGALYSTTFTPPSSPFTTTVSAGTVSLLCLMTNAGILDNAEMNNLETVGNAQISTAQSKFGGASMAFDGTGDWLVMPPSPNFALGTGDFTIEGWAYITSFGSVNARGVFQQGTSSFPASVSNTVALGVNPSGTWVIFAKNTNTNSTATLSTGTWAHFALVRSGTTTTLYANGTSVITVTSDSTNYTGTYFGIGSIFGTSDTNWHGYIDDLRITKGYARYTTSFTAPTAPFPLQ